MDSKYLGLPSLIGKSKKKVFNFIKERVLKRIQGWSNSKLSRAGKAVMIKNVAQAIPSYCMSCFLIPKLLSQEIERILNGFWWKSGANNGKGLRWLSWEKMCKSKNKGGLGFRSLYGFNLALLGKHVWHLLNNTGSLVERVFKARYFQQNHFLKA
ncbi:putative mitochondrial protein AtMg00310 [Apium graveolens]|uniref:putative mitochondrial protein AtMg00310 n=1 Tax=Apium graveolens TaxID=4045 RepID=UPI003D7B3D06